MLGNGWGRRGHLFGLWTSGWIRVDIGSMVDGLCVIDWDVRAGASGCDGIGWIEGTLRRTCSTSILSGCRRSLQSGALRGGVHRHYGADACTYRAAVLCSHHWPTRLHCHIQLFVPCHMSLCDALVHWSSCHYAVQAGLSVRPRWPVR